MLTRNDIRHAVSHSAYRNAESYVLRGDVIEVTATDETHIHGIVVGTASRPYEQNITLRPSGSRTIVNGSCSCMVGRNCKHVAAVLLAHLAPSEHLPLPAPDPATMPLPNDVQAWLRAIEAANVVETEDYPPSIRKRLFYILHASPALEGQRVQLCGVERTRDGWFTGPSRMLTPNELSNPGQQPKYLRPSDRRIIGRLASFSPRSAEFITTLQDIVATGRARLERWDGPVLTIGKPIDAGLTWSATPTGQQRLVLELPAGLQPLLLAEPWYVNPANGAIGPVQTGLQPRLVNTLLSSPPLPPHIASRVGAELATRTPDLPVPKPAAYAAPQPLSDKLQPAIRLLQGNIAATPGPGGILYPRYDGRTEPLPLARLSWRYGPVWIPHADQGTVFMHEGKLVQVTRDRAVETKAINRLTRLGFRPLNTSLAPRSAHAEDFYLMETDEEDWVDIMLEELPGLQKAGWHVEIDDDFPVRLVKPSGSLWVDVDETSGIDWLELGVGVMVDGARVDLIPALVAWVAGGMEIYGDDDDASLMIPLPDGRQLVLPHAQLFAIIEPLMELFGNGKWADGGASVRIARHDAASLAALDAAAANAGIAWSGGDAVRALGRQLSDSNGIPRIEPPATVNATLRVYQKDGLSWLQFLREAQLGGVLADDMGLGKTLQALAHIATEQAAGRLDRPALVICPTSLVANWAAEAARFTPTLRVLALHGPARATQFPAIPDSDLVITTYPLLARDHETLAAQEWHAVLLDEAQTIKNPLATTSKLARTLKARQRLCLSGTPLENHLGELWSLFDFLMPGFLGDRKAFGSRYRNPIEKEGDTDIQASLARRVAPFLLRRTKEQVATDLPAKTEITETIEMGQAQRAVYESIRLAMHAKVRAAIEERGLARSGIVILDALLKLRQACCDPRLLPIPSAKKAKAGSAKLDRLMEMLPTLLEEGRRILLFSQFTSMLDLIEAELNQLNLPFLLLTGDTKDRATPVRRFQSGEVPLFLISLKAGGTGLNLTAADTVIHYDPWWNPAVEEQATDRAHRIGQDKPVFVHRLVTAASIEEKMTLLKERKQALADGILGSTGEAAVKLTESDLEVLFAAT